MQPLTSTDSSKCCTTPILSVACSFLEVTLIAYRHVPKIYIVGQLWVRYLARWPRTFRESQVNILTRSNPQTLEALDFRDRSWYAAVLEFYYLFILNVPQRSVFKQCYSTFTAPPAGAKWDIRSIQTRRMIMLTCRLMSACVSSPRLGSAVLWLCELNPGLPVTTPAAAGTLSFSCLSRGEWADDCDELGRRTRRARRRKGQVLMWVKVCWEGRK